MGGYQRLPFGHIGWVFGLKTICRNMSAGLVAKFDSIGRSGEGLTIVGVTGLMLYDPVLTSDYMPG